MNKIESIVLNDKKILINICDKNNIVSDVDANIMLDNNVNAIDIIESIKLPKSILPINLNISALQLPEL